MQMLFCSFSLKAKRVKQVMIAQPPATVWKSCAKAEYSQAWETGKAIFSRENSAKDSYGHYKQVKCNVCPLVSIVFDVSSTRHMMNFSPMNEKWDRATFNPILFLFSSWWICLKTNRGYWWSVFVFITLVISSCWRNISQKLFCDKLCILHNPIGFTEFLLTSTHTSCVAIKYTITFFVMYYLILRTCWKNIKKKIKLNTRPYYYSSKHEWDGTQKCRITDLGPHNRQYMELSWPIWMWADGSSHSLYSFPLR